MAELTEMMIHGVMTPVLKLNITAEEFEEQLRSEIAAEEAEEYKEQAAESAEEAQRWAVEAGNAATGAPKIHASQHASDGEDPLTPAMIGVVSKAGDTMTGSLVVERTAQPSIAMKDTTQGRYAGFAYNANEETIISNTKDLQNRVLLFLRSENNIDNLMTLSRVVGGQWTDYNVLHTGNHGMKLLWENANPTSEFPAQQIFVNFKEYNLAIVRFSRDTGGGYQTAVCVKNKEIDASTAGYISIPGLSKKGVAARRYVKMTDDYMNFGGGNFDTSSTDSTPNNFAMIPVEIYGIKGGF